jgi:hypothetical protein
MKLQHLRWLIGVLSRPSWTHCGFERRLTQEKATPLQPPDDGSPEGSGPAVAGASHRRHAGHQRGSAQSVVFRSVLRNGRWLLAADRVLAVRWQSAGAVYQLVGCALYLVGTILVTILFNVPRNDALAAVEAGSADGAAPWAQYVPGWTAWNHIRAAAALAAAAALTVAVCLTENPVTGAAPIL